MAAFGGVRIDMSVVADMPRPTWGIQRSSLTSPSVTAVGRGSDLFWQRHKNPVSVDQSSRADRLLVELGEIGRGRGFLRGGARDKRTREIGIELHRMNGIQKMREAHGVVSAEVGGVPARMLETAWDGIGEWAQ